MATNANIKLAILDFDGTIANTQTLIVDTILGVIEELSLPKLTREQCVAMIGLPLEKTFSTLIPMNNEMSQRCAKAYERIYCEKTRQRLCRSSRMFTKRSKRSIRAERFSPLRRAVTDGRSRSLCGSLKSMNSSPISWAPTT